MKILLQTKGFVHCIMKVLLQNVRPFKVLFIIFMKILPENVRSFKDFAHGIYENITTKYSILQGFCSSTCTYENITTKCSPF